VSRPGRRWRRLRRLWRRLRGGELSRLRAAASVAVGLFIGSTPLYGLHFPLCLAICVPFRLDAVIAYIAANISNPVIAPFLLAAELQVGSLLLHGSWLELDRESLTEVGLSGFIGQLVVGALVVGSSLALLGGSLAWLLAREPEPGEGNDLDGAMARTRARYAGTAPGDRFYVAIKLVSDPVVEQLEAQPGDFGRVLDAGCGRGQLGLCLLELGRARSLRGFDADARKVAVAQEAAGGDADFQLADLTSAPLEEADTILMMDVLHYLPRARQDELLDRAAMSLTPGGRLFVRELDAGARLGSWPARFAEHVARAIGMNRGAELEFRPIQEVVERLNAAGLCCELDRSGSLANALVMARRPVSVVDLGCGRQPPL
jgi:uncharacterized protein (DUF2062 family)/SAM-dependent methyltransferase